MQCGSKVKPPKYTRKIILLNTHSKFQPLTLIYSGSMGGSVYFENSKREKNTTFALLINPENWFLDTLDNF